MQQNRIIGLDLARALSLFGMMMVNFKLAVGAENSSPDWLASFSRLFEGRASAVFVVLAGIGFSIMTRKAQLGDSAERHRQTVLIGKRCLYLLALGLMLLLLGWSADILHYYAVFMAAGLLLLRASNRLLICLAALVALVGQTLLLGFHYEAGWDSSYHAYTDFWTPEGFLRNLFFNGYHPFFPWFSFFLAGMRLGRLDLANLATRRRLLITGLTITVLCEAASWTTIRLTTPYLGAELAVYLFQTKPMPPNLLYLTAAASLAVVVIMLAIRLAESPVIRAAADTLLRTGQMTLTHYVLHVVIGMVVLDLLGILENGSLVFAVSYTMVYFIGCLIFSRCWSRMFERGPLETLMRKL